MPGPLFGSLDTDVRTPGGDRVVVIAFNGTTDGSGVLTLPTGQDYDGQLTVQKSGNNYIVSVGAFKRRLYGHAIGYAAAPFHSTGFTDSPTSGTVTINFGASVNSAQLNVFFVFER